MNNVLIVLEDLIHIHFVTFVPFLIALATRWGIAVVKRHPDWTLLIGILEALSNQDLAPRKTRAEA